MPERLPTPPEWPQLSIPQPAADAAATDAAQVLLPLSTQDPAELVSPGDAEAAASSRDGNDTIFTAGVVALFVAAFLAAAICAFAALLRRRRPAAWKEGLKAREAAAGGMVAGGIVGGGKGGDAASHAAAKLGRQLDLYGADDLFMEKYELLGRDRGSRGSAHRPPSRPHATRHPLASSTSTRFVTRSLILFACSSALPARTSRPF